MKHNHNCKHRHVCENYLYSTCEGCNLNKGLWNNIVSLVHTLRGKVNNAYKENVDFLLSLQGKSHNDDVCEILKKDICSYYSGIESAVHSIWDYNPSSNFNLIDFIPLQK